MVSVEEILHHKFGVTGNVIENAHRTGKPSKDKPRLMIARFFSRAVRGIVMRSARKKHENTPLRLIDDLTKEDLKVKQRVRPYMDVLYEDNKRPSFRNGKLYADGREVTPDEINTFLDSQ